MLGYIAAVAMPMLALATCMSASSDKMSGRCLTRSDGRLTGRSIGSESPVRSMSGRVALDGTTPSSVASKCSAWLAFCSKGASKAWLAASRLRTLNAVE